MSGTKSVLRFLDDRRGGVMPLFALTIIPLTGLIGAAVDYSRANAARSAMQAAVDSTALAMAKNAQTMTPAQLQVNATNYFNALYTRAEATNVAVSTSYTTSNAAGSQVVVSSSGTVKPIFVSMMGVADFNIGATSTTVWGQQRLRVALALDNTGSMADAGKMTALKTASHNLLKSLKDASKTDGDVYVSIIPFSKDVNAGAGNVSASWIDWTDWEAANGSNVQACTGSGKSKKCTTNWVPKAHSAWNGCVTDRDQNYDERNTTPSESASSTLFPAEQYASCPTAVMGATYDWTTLNDKVDAMTPAGNTNQSIGLAWAWQSLTAGKPFDPPAKDQDYKYQDVIILLTDGLNTQNRYSSNQSAIDARQQVTCTNAKAADVTIYTVQVNTGNDATSSLLQSCASDANKFFLLTSANQIITTFNAIGTQLSQLRISK